MANGVYDVRIIKVKGHWEIYVNDEFFCTTDSYVEAVNELREAYGR